MAAYERGVLLDLDFELMPSVECLPVRPRSVGIQRIALQAIYREAAQSLSTWSGEIVDLRERESSIWTIERKLGSQESLLELEVEKVVRDVPKAVWKKIAWRLYRALKLDQSLVEASRWAMLGADNSLDAYDKLRRAGFKPFDIEPGAQRTLAAHAISAAIGAGLRPCSTRESVRSFQLDLYSAGVTPAGWRLLLDSPLKDWIDTMRHESYDIDITALSLMIGQKLSPPRLPDPRFINEIREIKFSNQMGDSLRCIPPQVWRTSYERFEASRRKAIEELQAVIPWAGNLGASMPKGMRNAGWKTFLNRAHDQLIVEAVCNTAIQPKRFEHEGFCAIEITSEHALKRIARLMNNCLDTLWPDMEAGFIRIFIATSEDRRAAISLRPRLDGAGWGVDQIAGPSNRDADVRFIDFAERLSKVCTEKVTCALPSSSHASVEG